MIRYKFKSSFLLSSEDGRTCKLKVWSVLMRVGDPPSRWGEVDLELMVDGRPVDRIAKGRYQDCADKLWFSDDPDAL